jgi:signal transduction histidine kinase
MNKLRTQIAGLVIIISIAAALVAAFVPHYVYELRDYLFVASLAELDQIKLQNLLQDYGQCSPQVSDFKEARGGMRWELNYNVALAILITLTAIVGAFLSLRLAGAIAAPIVQLSDAAKAIANGAHDDVLLPSKKSASAEIDTLTQNFSAMAQTLKAADQDLRLRSNGIAHELRTPLAVMRGRLIGAQNHVFSADGAFIDALLRQVGLIERLTNDLSMLCDTRSASLSLNKQATSLTDIIDAVIESLTPMAQQADVTFHSDLKPVIATIDASRIERAISNIVENAIHHSNGKIVKILLKHDATHCTVTVEDDGSAWPVDNPQTLTQAFVTGNSENSTRSNRTGLGLAIVDAIVSAHRGQIMLETATSGGAIITILLPK